MTIANVLGTASLFFIPLLAVLAPILIGERYGIYRIKKTPGIKDTPVGSVVGAALGLLGFMLAFTFQIAANRYDARKQKLVEEVTNLRTTYLRSGLIPEPYRSNTKKLVIEYVDLAAGFGGDYTKLGQALSRTEQILDTLWKYSEALADQDRSSEAYSLYTSSVNDLIDAHNQRITFALEYRIPAAILWVLFIIEFLSMFAFGYQFGISGKGSFRLSLLIATIFAIVMFLIFALDRPEKGLAKLSQKPMHSLQRQLKEK